MCHHGTCVEVRGEPVGICYAPLPGRIELRSSGFITTALTSLSHFADFAFSLCCLKQSFFVACVAESGLDFLILLSFSPRC